MRVLEPHTTGFAVNADDGVRSYYEIFGPNDAERTVLFLPTWMLVHSRCWKMQVPYFARRGFRVVTFDPRGNGRSDRPESGYTTGDLAQDTLAVYEAAGIEQAALVAYSAGGRWATQFAAQYPDQVSHLVLLNPAVRLHGGARLDLEPFHSEPPDREDWNKYNAVHWREQYPDFVEWFVGEIFSEPHSTKQVDDFTSWALETTPEVLIQSTVESVTPRMAEFWQSIQQPTLIIHGDDDHVIAFENTLELREALPHAEVFIIGGGGHGPLARDPVRVNLTIHEFLNRRQVTVKGEELEHAGD